MNKICVYAIAKNEEQNVEAWVESMRPADHIIVLDTGSTDKTVELLSSLGVEVHEKAYEHFRFDTARNDCLDLIPDEYNIRVSIDLDERFEDENWANLLREEWDEDNPRVLYKYVWNHTDDGRNGLEFIINKIHGIDPNLRWVGAVHEHLTYMDTGERGFTKFVDLTDKLVVHHYADLSRDRMFYMDLAEERISENTEDYLSWMLHANEQRVKGDPKKGVEAYKYILEHFQSRMSVEEIAATYYGLGQCYNILEDGFNAMIAYSSGIAIDKYYRDNYFGLALILVASELYDMAIGVLQEGLKTTRRVYGWMEDPFTWTFSLYDLLALTYHLKGEDDKALGYASKALSYDPKNEVLIKRFNDLIKLV